MNVTAQKWLFKKLIKDIPMMETVVETYNGLTRLTPVFCEMTGRPVCWMTIVPEDEAIKGVTPAYLSFEVVGADGEVDEYHTSVDEKGVLDTDLF